MFIQGGLVQLLEKDFMKTLPKYFIPVLISVASMPALAEGMYANLGYSMGSLEVKSNGTILADSTNSDVDEDSNKIGFDIGYFVTENIAVEFGYRTAEADENYYFDAANTLGIGASTEATVIKFGAKAFTSRDEQIYAFGGAGLASLELEQSITHNTIGAADYPVGRKITADSNNLYYTIGAGYRITEQLGVEISYADYGDAGTGDDNDINDPGKMEMSEINLGISYRF